MKKKGLIRNILIGVGIFIMLLGGIFMYVSNRNRTLSILWNLIQNRSVFPLPITDPSLRNRLIFGTQSDGALSLTAGIWRLGANESTEVTFSEETSMVNS